MTPKPVTPAAPQPPLDAESWASSIENLVGRTGRVWGPRGDWGEDWICTGVEIFNAEERKASLTVESTKRLVTHIDAKIDRSGFHPEQNIVREEPAKICTALPPRWFRPREPNDAA